MVVKKENRGDEGSKQFTSNCTADTEVLKFAFGTAKHFVQRSKDDKEADASDTNQLINLHTILLLQQPNNQDGFT